MPRFDQPTGKPPPPIKMLYMGHSGAGKTGSLISLAAAGYRVRILDLDNKAHIIRDYVTNRMSIYRSPRPGLWTAEQADTLAERISYVTVTEGYNIRGSNAYPKGDSWLRANQYLNDWKDGEDRPGGIHKWGPDDVLVIDSFSRYCEAALYYQLSLTKHLESGPQVGDRGSNDYSRFYDNVRNQLQLLKSDEIACNIIVICHIIFMEPTNQPQLAANRPKRGFPQVYGNAYISPQIPQYFSHSARATSIGDYPSVKRTILTNNDDNVELINPAPSRIKHEYNLDTGLAEYFRDFRASIPKEEPTQPAQAAQ